MWNVQYATVHFQNQRFDNETSVEGKALYFIAGTIHSLWNWLTSGIRHSGPHTVYVNKKKDKTNHETNPGTGKSTVVK